MTKKNISSIKLDEDFLKFSEKAQTNRVILKIDTKTIGHPRMSKLMERFFKLHNEAYLELINMAEEVNA